MSARTRALASLCERVLQTRAEVGERWPYSADASNGTWHTTDDGDWCSGHWIEMLRIVGERSGDRSLVDEARSRTRACLNKLDREDMFRGPQFYYSATRLAATEEDAEMREVAWRAAKAMRAMALPYNGALPIGRQVQVLSTDAGAPDVVAVDNVNPCLLLHWWVLRETQDETVADGARRHLDTTTRDFVRTDGSTNEFIEYDPANGVPRRVFTLLGQADDSTWSRGQAWAISGYLRAYEELGDEWYLDTGCRLLEYYWARANEHHVPPWDFQDRDPGAPIDTSAAAIVVNQLARLAVRDDRPGSQRVLARMDPLLDALCGHYLTGGGDGRPAGMLLSGCFNYPRRFAYDAELLWGDFYLLEALHCLDRGGLPT